MEPLEYVRLFRRRWRLIAACVIVAAVVALVTTPSKSNGGAPTYVSDATMVRDGSATTTPALSSVQLFMRTGEVPDRVAKRIGYQGNPLKLARSLAFKADDQLGTLTVTGTGSSPQEATDIANAFVEETIGYLGEQAQTDRQQSTQQLNDQVNQLQAQLADLDRQIAAAGGATAGGATLLEAQRSAVQSQYGAAFSELQKALTAPTASAGVKILEPAEADLASVKSGGISAPRSRVLRTGFGAVIGLLLGLVLVLVLERFDPRLVTRESVEAAFALPVVADVPDEAAVRGTSTIYTLTEPSSALAERYRSLRAALLLMPSHVLQHATVPGAVETFPPDEREVPLDQPRVIIVTSASPGDGKTSTVANLAVAFAETGRSVLVLGYDFRRPSIHHDFGSLGGRGIMDVLRTIESDHPIALADVVQSTQVPGVSLVPHGTGEESHGDVAAHGRQILDEARKLADVVVVDTPPLLVTNDAVELIPAADSTAIVCRSHKTTRDAATRTRDLLQRLGASVTGVVLIGAPEPEGKYYGSYREYYHYTSASGDKKRRRSRGKRRHRDD